MSDKSEKTSDKTKKQAISEEHKIILQLVESLKDNTDKGSFIVINYGKTLEYLLNALEFYKGHLEREGTTKDGVIKAMDIIREWCESRDALENPCDCCPMDSNCSERVNRLPDEWVVEE